MKNLTTTIMLLSTLSLFSCSKLIYSNEQVMNKYKTKGDVIKQFGPPTEKRSADAAEEWLYSYDRQAGNPDTTAKKVTNFSIYKRFIIFNLDMQGNVLNWRCEGVDFGKRKAQPGKTLALVAGSVGLIAGLVTLAMHSFTFNPGPIAGGR